MGMSTHIVAFVPDIDPTYQKHAKAWFFCEREGLSLPKETEEYFGSCCDPEEKLEFPLKYGAHYIEWKADMQEGYEIDLTKLPKEISRIRFFNSY